MPQNTNEISPQILKQYLANLAYLRNSIVQDTTISDEEKEKKLSLLNSENDEMLQTFDLYKVILELESTLSYEEIVAKINSLDLEKTQKFQQLDEDITTFKQSKTQEFDTEKQALFNQVQSSISDFKNQIWDDVGGALGQLHKTVYVNSDPNIGSDSNAGTSSSPFLTLKKALISTTSSGKLYVALQTDVEMRASNGVSLHNRGVEIRSADDEDKKITFILDNNNRACLYLYNSDINCYGTIQIETLNESGILAPVFAMYRNSYLEYKNKLILGSNTQLAYIKSATILLYLNQENIFSDDNCRLITLSFGGDIFLGYGNGTINGERVTDEILRPYIYGRAYNSNNAPINFKSNKLL